jgi:hypothetical protein
VCLTPRTLPSRHRPGADWTWARRRAVAVTVHVTVVVIQLNDRVDGGDDQVMTGR